jgi:uncharacterized membrane protein
LIRLSNAALEGGAGSARPRAPAVDIARGIAVAAMVVYHLAWDLSELRLIALDVTAEPGWRFFARAIAASFLFLVGIGLALAHPGRIRWRPFGRRLATVAAASLLITAGTFFAFPESYIFFGILHAITLSSLIALPFTQAPAWVSGGLAILVASAPLVLGGGVFDAPALAFLGLGSRPPITNDWVPLFPWAAFVLAGVALGRVGRDRLAASAAPVRSPVGRALAWAGRHSLAIYLLHQPLLFGALFGIAQLTGPNLAAVAARVERSCPVSYVQAGMPDAAARAVCACTIAGMQAQGLWTDFLRERLAAGQQAELSRIARACKAQVGPTE